MKSHLHTLHDSESVLLMYLFDELPPDDRAEVESMLSTDTGLRRQLEQLRAIHEQTAALVDRVDGKGVSPATLAVVQERAVKAMETWSVRRTLTAPAAAPMRRSHRWIAYSAAAAALVAIAVASFVILYDPGDTHLGPGQNEFADVDDFSPQQRLFAQSLSDPSALQMVDETTWLMQPTEDRDLLRRSLDVSDELFRDAVRHRGLSDAESQLAQLAVLDDDELLLDGVLFQ